MVTIKLNLTLIKSVDKKELFINLNAPKPLKEILYKIDISQDEIGMVFINGKWATIDSIIEENDVVQLFPHLEGG